MSDTYIDKILFDLREKHGIVFFRTSNLDSLINYVSHISYNKGYADRKTVERNKVQLNINIET